MIRKKTLVASLLAVALATFFGSGAIRAGHYARAFETVAIGQPEATVLAKFGPPGVTDTRRAPFLRYASQACTPPCSRRLWWEHPLLPSIEAWSITLDTTGKVVDKAHWVSP